MLSCAACVLCVSIADHDDRKLTFISISTFGGSRVPRGHGVSRFNIRRFTMCALVMKSNSVALPKVRNWGLIDQLRWKLECLIQRARGEV